ncbi:(2Fe-2S)-binding protein [Pseudomaricurvus alkylphenolicus]|nr:(2Fe-2S)-binding protein [Pseudomaricurvus alkylphenolicus]NIB40826.1 (2Fe-2S)-binding protein [Pseudomaricurvus alkylphenolicus]
MINGKLQGPFEVPEGLMLIDFLHEYMNLTGTHFGCGQGMCRACTVIYDKDDGTSEERRACITGVHYFNGKRIRTIEGHASHNDAGEVVSLSPVQQAFLDHYSFQCGYCTPGFVNAATLLVEKLSTNPISRDQLETVIEEALGEHICRCTGYVRYYQAVKATLLDIPGLVV